MNTTAGIRCLVEHDILSKERADALVERAAAGDARAERILFEHNHRLVSHAVCSLIRAPGTFEDLYQDGLIAFHEAIKTYQPALAERFSAYAYVVVRRRLINALKNRKNASLVAFQPGGSWEDLLALPDEQATDEEAISSCEAEEVAAQLAILSEREVRIVRSYYGIGVEQKPMTEIARAQNVSHERIRQIHWRAIGKLRRSMGVGEEVARPVHNPVEPR